MTSLRRVRQRSTTTVTKYKAIATFLLLHRNLTDPRSHPFAPIHTARDMPSPQLALPVERSTRHRLLDPSRWDARFLNPLRVAVSGNDSFQTAIVDLVEAAPEIYPECSWIYRYILRVVGATPGHSPLTSNPLFSSPLDGTRRPGASSRDFLRSLYLTLPTDSSPTSDSFSFLERISSLLTNFVLRLPSCYAGATFTNHQYDASHGFYYYSLSCGGLGRLPFSPDGAVYWTPHVSLGLFSPHVASPDHEHPLLLAIIAPPYRRRPARAADNFAPEAGYIIGLAQQERELQPSQPVFRPWVLSARPRGRAVLVNGDVPASYLDALRKGLPFPEGVEMKVYVSEVYDLCDGEQRCRFVDAYLNVLKGLVFRCATERKAAPEGEVESDEDL